ncbi:MAG: hypothetical protein R3C03_23175 [Pirellulaceae bacterium]
MKHLLLLISFLSLTQMGCNVNTGLAPIEQVVSECSPRDFGFSGNWQAVPNPEFSYDAAASRMVIEFENDYRVRFIDPGGKADETTSVQFRTYEISPEQPHAIVEIEVLSGETIEYRRLAIVAVKDGYLCVWMIDGKKIGEYLFNGEVPAVIEHFPFSSSVRCNADKLLATIASHAREVVGNVQVFQRVEED